MLLNELSNVSTLRSLKYNKANVKYEALHWYIEETPLYYFVKSAMQRNAGKNHEELKKSTIPSIARAVT